MPLSTWDSSFAAPTPGSAPLNTPDASWRVQGPARKDRPEPLTASEPGAHRPLRVAGIGVSAGIAVGLVRVVLDPAEADAEPGEVLVSPTTDPSWASLLFASAALVVDVGGAMSHAAVVARELGIPCVVNTRTGTDQLATGDRVRVDGNMGTIDILARSQRSV